MKQIGIIGNGRGRLGNVVARVRRGVQINSVYQPVVANPSTDAQVKQRARFKLMAQIASAAKDVINEPYKNVRKGLQSSFNAFVQKNLPLVLFNEADGKAYTEYSTLNYTGSRIASGATITRAPLSATFAVNNPEFAGGRMHIFKYVTTEPTGTPLETPVFLNVETIDIDETGVASFVLEHPELANTFENYGVYLSRPASSANYVGYEDMNGESIDETSLSIISGSRLSGREFSAAVISKAVSA